MKAISSLSNSQIKELVRLRQARERRSAQLFIVDGQREIRQAQEGGWDIQEIFYCPGLAKHEKRLINLKGVKLTEVSVPVFEKICYKDKPDGYLALAKYRESSLAEIKLSRRPLVIILESIEKPGNLGAIIRTAQAIGADAVIVNDNQTDLLNANVIRASEGLVFKQTIAIASVADTQAWLKAKKIKAFAAATSSQKTYYQADLSGPSAIVLGSEAKGLSNAWLESNAELIKIPMVAGVDSLNVSVSAAVIVYEAFRQRTMSQRRG